MSLMNATPDAGVPPPIFNTPDANSRGYEAMDINLIGEDDDAAGAAPERVLTPERALRVEAPGDDAPEGALLASGRRRLYRCIVYNRRTGYIYYWYWCYR